jgi:hypothetical protein
MATRMDLWTFREGMSTQSDLTGFKIEALDGGIGKIDEATYEAGGSYLVIDTGPWIFGKKVMIPAGIVDRVDYDTETAFVDRTKDEIKSAPEYDETMASEPTYREQLGTYYGSGAARNPDDELV